MTSQSDRLRPATAPPGPPAGRRGPDPAAAKWAKPLMALVVFTCLGGVSVGLGTTVLVLSLVGAGLLVVGLSEPRLAMLGAWVLVTLDPFNKNGLIASSIWRFNTINVLLVATLLTQLARLIRRRDAHTAIWLVLLGVMTAMLVGAPDIGLGVAEVLGAVAPLALVGICARVGADVVAWRGAAEVVGVLGAMLGPLYYLRSPADLNPNSVSFAFLAPLFLVTVVPIFFEVSGRVRARFLVLACTHVAWVFLTASRGALLMALVALCALAIAGIEARQRLLLALAAVVTIMVLATQVTASNSATLRRVGKLFNSEQTVDSRTSGRTLLIRNGLEVFRDNPGGVGTGGFIPATALVVNADRNHRDAHAAWVKVLTENGVAGGGLLVLYVGSFAVAGRRGGRANLSLGVTTTVVLAIGFATSEFGAKGLWVLPVAATVLIHADREVER